MEKKQFVILFASTILSAFLGAFLAANLVLPQLLKASQPPAPIIPRPKVNIVTHAPIVSHTVKQKAIISKMDKMSQVCMNQPPIPENFPFINNNMMNIANMTSLKTEETADYYKLKINLKPFNNDPKNIKIKIKSDSLMISGNYKSKNKKENYSANFNQSLRFPFRFKKGGIKKQKSGDELIVIIPKANTKI